MAWASITLGHIVRFALDLLLTFQLTLPRRVLCDPPLLGLTAFAQRRRTVSQGLPVDPLCRLAQPCRQIIGGVAFRRGGLRCLPVALPRFPCLLEPRGKLAPVEPVGVLVPPVTASGKRQLTLPRSQAIQNPIRRLGKPVADMACQISRQLHDLGRAGLGLVPGRLEGR